jgi:hypothetical protein
MTNAGAEMTCRIYLKEWVTVYGPPKRLITDRGTNFTSVYFDELAKFLGTKPTQTVAYRPQANGQNERTHRDFHQYISLYIEQADRRHWDTLLKLASWSHNTSYHEALRTSPYEFVFGIKPNISKMWIPSRIDEIDESQLQEYFGLKKESLERLRDAAKQAIARSQDNFLMRQNRRRPAQKYSEGQLILVKQHRASKWAPKWEGPFKIKSVISENTFRIQKLDSNQEDTVHIDYIRPFYSRDGSPAIGNDASFPEELDERSDNINYETQYLFDKPSEDMIIEVDTRMIPSPSNKVAEPASSALSPRVTRSKTRQINQQLSPDLQKPDVHAPASTNSSTKQKSVLSRARASLKKVLPKQVSFPFSRKDISANTRQHIYGAPDASTSTAHEPPVRTSTPAPALATSPVSQFTTSVSNQTSNTSLDVQNSIESTPALTIDIVPAPIRPVINKKTVSSRQYKTGP